MTLQLHQLVLVIGFSSVFAGMVLILVDLMMLRSSRSEEERILKKVTANSQVPEDIKQELTHVFSKNNTRIPPDDLKNLFNLIEHAVNKKAA